MSTVLEVLPITEMFEPSNCDDLCALIASAHDSKTAIYPLGGETALNFGLPAKHSGWGVSLKQFDQVIDYPARDMTITVEAGVSMQSLAETLAKENQRLPIDVPQASEATLGGVIATNFNGPRRYGMGTVRDYVIGIHAVDGTGRAFKGGGRVVKNVAGYDFCKLLTGSLGTLAVIHQVTLKVKPCPQRSAIVVGTVKNLAQAENVLAELVTSATTPAAIELLCGPVWHDDAIWDGDAADELAIAVGLEGTDAEVQWMSAQLLEDLETWGVENCREVEQSKVADAWTSMSEFPAQHQSPLVLKGSVVPGATTKLIEAILGVDPNCSIQAHAGNGIVIASFSEFPVDGLSRTLLAKLHPVANSAQGNIVVLSNPGGHEMTHQSVWGGIHAPFRLMTDVKQRFDPQGILNPGRFVYV